MDIDSPFILAKCNNLCVHKSHGYRTCGFPDVLTATPIILAYWPCWLGPMELESNNMWKVPGSTLLSYGVQPSIRSWGWAVEGYHFLSLAFQ